MKKFLELIRIIKQQGGLYHFDGEKITQGLYPQNLVLNFIDQIQPFVLPKFNNGELIEYSSDQFGEEDYAQPFPAMSIEVMDSYSAITNSRFPSPLYLHCIVLFDKVPGVESENVMVLLVQFDLDSGKMAFIFPYEEFKSMAALLLKVINSNESLVGVEKTSQPINIAPSGERKKYANIKKVIYILPKGKKRDHLATRQIEWTHRWWTRGHWRMVTGMGKNREGLYCESGRTWVVEYQKGEGELVNKVRIVK